MVRSLLLAAGVAVAVATPAAAVTNIGFEAGNLDGWTVANGPAQAVTSFGSYTPRWGNWFALLTSNSAPNLYSTLTQTVWLRANVTIRGVFGFQTTDYLPYNDDGYVSVNGTPLVTASVASVGNFGSSGWLPWSFTAPTTGAYTLQLGVRNRIDGAFNSFAIVDAAIPEPATWMMLITGFGLVGLGARRGRRIVSA